MDMFKGTCEHGKVWVVCDAEIYFNVPCVICEGRLVQASTAVKAQVVKTLRTAAQAAWCQDVQTDLSVLIPA